jgi:hypothetical protein
VKEVVGHVDDQELVHLVRQDEALATVLVLALVGYGGPRRDDDRYAAAVAGAAGAKVVALTATSANTGTCGSLVVPANGSAP